jgi:nitrite reductase/ring-hydroxylating ferredoxin subunit
MPIIELSLQEIPSETLFRVKREGVAMVVFRSAGRVSAFADVCPHAAWPLSQGEVEEGVVECPGHGWKFSLATGQCLNAPAYCLTPVLTTIEGDRVRFEFAPLPDRDSCQRLQDGSGA